MEKLKDLFQSRKFWALVLALATVFFGWYSNGLPVEQSVYAAIAALSAYSLGVALEG